jgi:uncharacterized repeat protein (TIGR03803 family)
MTSSLKSAAFAAMLLGASQVSGGTATAPALPVSPVGNSSHLRTPQVCALYHFGLKEHDPLWITRTGALAVDQQNNVYGAGPQGGEHGRGVIFKVSPDGELTHIHDFNFTDGADPEGGVTMGKDGDLYGTTYVGGKFATGSLFFLSTRGDDFGQIWDFRNGWLRPLKNKYDHWTPKEILDSKGSYPVSPPVQTRDGHWYGVTSYSNNQQFGVLYEIGFNALQVFDGQAANYAVSLSPGVTDNNAYGVTWHAGKQGPYGTVFRVSNGGFSVIHTFQNTDGAGPVNVIQGKDGRIYGTTVGGAAPDKMNGVIYSMTSDGGDYKILHKFDINGGLNPIGGVVWGSDNRLYGTTQYGGSQGRGVAYRIDPDGNNFTVLHNFHFYQTGRRPIGRMVEGPDHNFYGTTYEGGKFDGGVVFKLDAGLSDPPSTEGFQGRWCCSLGQGAGVTTKAIDPTQIQGHHYGGGDPVGFVYTTHIGLVDLGHARDNADMTKYLYDYLMMLGRGGKTYLPLPLVEGVLQVHKLPADQDAILDMAGAIAYLEAWAHELTTWGTLSQDFSSFSPEDLVSNVVGITVGKLAIRDCCEVKYDQAVDIQLLKMLNDLGAQPGAVTEQKLREIWGPAVSYSKAGKWFTSVGPVEVIWRRNFYPYPWLIPYSSVGAYKPGWLTTEYFKPYWDGTWFDYTIKNPVEGKTGITLKQMQPVTDALHGKWVKDNPGMDKWP